MNISKHPNIPGVVLITAEAPGPHLVLFAGVHGDEVSGVHAIEKLFFDLFSGSRVLQRGAVTLARANALALAAERRYIKHNLNRLFRTDYGPDIDRSSYEFRRAQELKTILERCDYFLDLHSAPIAQEPFIVVETGAAAFFAKLGIKRIMTGWSKFSSGSTGGDAENYANAQGAKSATLESGSHFDKRSNDVAYHTVLAFLSQLDLIEQEKQTAEGDLEMVDVYAVITKEYDDFRYQGNVQNFQRFKEGEVFAFQNGRPMAVTEDTVLLIPMKPHDTKLHEEVCYLGRMVASA